MSPPTPGGDGTGSFGMGGVPLTRRGYAEIVAGFIFPHHSRKRALLARLIDHEARAAGYGPDGLRRTASIDKGDYGDDEDYEDEDYGDDD